MEPQPDMLKMDAEKIAGVPGRASSPSKSLPK